MYLMLTHIGLQSYEKIVEQSQLWQNNALGGSCKAVGTLFETGHAQLRFLGTNGKDGIVALVGSRRQRHCLLRGFDTGFRRHVEFGSCRFCIIGITSGED